MKLYIVLFICSSALLYTDIISGSPPDVTNATIRLVGGLAAHEGRLEIFYNNSWGSVCGDGFDDTAAGVACANLGFGSDGKFSENRFGPGTGPIWLDDLRCIGTEPSLAQCRHSDWGVHDCAHKDDVSIVCFLVEPVELRLVGGPTVSEGRLEVKYNGTWGSICDDSFDNVEASVACASLGFRNGGRFAHNSYGPGSGKIWMDNVRCIGTESSLAQCRHNGWGEHDCAHKEDVSIACLSPTSTTQITTQRPTTSTTTTLPACLGSSSPYVLNSATGWFTSRNYPMNYDNNMNCYWLIESPFTNAIVTLRFTYLDLESGLDVVTLYDGITTSAPQIALIVDNHYAHVDFTSSHRHMLVNFYSDHSVTYRGFNATYRSTEVGPSIPTTTSVSTTENNHQVFRDINGTIVSPNYPVPYDRYVDKSWLIMSTDYSKIVSINFAAFNTEPNYDVCTIYDGMDDGSTKLATLSGSGIWPLRYTTTQNQMYITFTSDGSYQRAGFSATFEIISRTATTTSTVRTTTPTPSTRASTTTESSHRVLWDNEGTISSPNFPQEYNYFTNVSWLIMSTDPNKVVSITFTEFNTESSFDVCTIYDGDNGFTKLGELSGIFYTWDLPPRYTSTRNSMYITFTSDGSVEHTGFSATFQIVPRAATKTATSTIAKEQRFLSVSTSQNEEDYYVDERILTQNAASSPNSLTDTSGSITSPNYPYNYPNNADVMWLIFAPPDGIVTLTIYFVDLETCCDHLNVYDGDNIHARKVEYTSDKEVYNSTQRYMLIHFTSDYSIAGRGFQATYSTTTIVTKGSTKWILVVVVASSVACLLTVIGAITVCVRRRRLQMKLNIRKCHLRYTMLQSESADVEELNKEQQDSPESKNTEKKQEAEKYPFFFILGVDDGATGDSGEISGFTDSMSPQRADSTEPAKLAPVILPEVHIRNYKTTDEKY